MTTTTDQKIGEHGARLDAIEDRLERIEKKQDRMLETLANHSGGIKALVAVGGLAGALGALVTQFIGTLPR